eukprot:1160727-Pelagomonas_calceolata.AAC.24
MKDLWPLFLPECNEVHNHVAGSVKHIGHEETWNQPYQKKLNLPVVGFSLYDAVGKAAYFMVHRIFASILTSQVGEMCARDSVKTLLTETGTPAALALRVLE